LNFSAAISFLAMTDFKAKSHFIQFSPLSLDEGPDDSRFRRVSQQNSTVCARSNKSHVHGLMDDLHVIYDSSSGTELHFTSISLSLSRSFLGILAFSRMSMEKKTERKKEKRKKSMNSQMMI
jgi:hypothetical protein